jgi:O-methyltransferase involved in polyketide biosynthesis
MARYRAVAAKLGRLEDAASGNLLYEGERTEVVDWLASRNWDVSAVSATDLMAGNGRFAPADLDDPIPQSVFVEGRLR